MSKSYPRFEILLPLQFNDGQPVPEELIGDTVLELRTQFGAISSETQIIRGIWEHKEQVYRDESVRLFADVPDTPENMNFFRDLKERLKIRFNQLEIWITSHSVDVL
jgi:hypothetical protein